jgi:hypothetical protein
MEQNRRAKTAGGRSLLDEGRQAEPPAPPPEQAFSLSDFCHGPIACIFSDCNAQALALISHSNQNDTITIQRICLSSLGTSSAPTVYFVPAADSIQRYDFSSGKVSTVVKTGMRLDFGLAVTRDGGAIYYTQMDHERSEVLLVENFR